jgi:hypothetical protein
VTWNGSVPAAGSVTIAAAAAWLRLRGRVART